MGDVGAGLTESAGARPGWGAGCGGQSLSVWHQVSQPGGPDSPIQSLDPEGCGVLCGLTWAAGVPLTAADPLAWSPLAGPRAGPGSASPPHPRSLGPALTRSSQSSLTFQGCAHPRGPFDEAAGARGTRSQPHPGG